MKRRTRPSRGPAFTEGGYEISIRNGTERRVCPEALSNVAQMTSNKPRISFFIVLMAAAPDLGFSAVQHTPKQMHDRSGRRRIRVSIVCSHGSAANHYRSKSRSRNDSDALPFGRFWFVFKFLSSSVSRRRNVPC